MDDVGFATVVQVEDTGFMTPAQPLITELLESAYVRAIRRPIGSPPLKDTTDASDGFGISVHTIV